MEFTEPQWRFTFLQHGVIKDDLSRWLNYKKIDLFVTSTAPEHDSIAGDHTPYPFTTKETMLTGLPRFDRLREIGERFRRRAARPGPGHARPGASGWSSRSPIGSQRARARRRGAATPSSCSSGSGCCTTPSWPSRERAGVQLGFLPHPNLQKLLPAARPARRTSRR